MKKLLISLLCVSTAFCAQEESTSIVDYELSHEAVVKEIFLQDPLQLFEGSHLLAKGIWSLEQFNESSRKSMEEMLKDPLRVKRVALESRRVAGLVEFFQKKESSLESFKKGKVLTLEKEAQILRDEAFKKN